MKAAKAKCPHGSPWFVECFHCATAVVLERVHTEDLSEELGAGAKLIRFSFYRDPKIYGFFEPYVQLSPRYCND